MSIAPVNETPMFRRSTYTQTMIDELLKVKSGEGVSYRTLTDALGLDVQDGGRTYLQSARRILESEHRIYFVTEKNIGLRRKTDSMMAMSGRSRRDRIRRQAKRGARELASVRDFDSLSSEEKITHNTEMSFMGILCEFTKPSRIRKIEGMVEESQRKLDLNETLRLFGG